MNKTLLEKGNPDYIDERNTPCIPKDRVQIKITNINCTLYYYFNSVLKFLFAKLIA